MKQKLKKRVSKNINNNKGFTLVEIMIVLAIVGLLFSFVGVNVIRKYQQAQVDSARIQMKNFESVLQTYYLDNNRFPNTQQGLDALVNKPSTGKVPKGWAGPYMKEKKVPDDPWGTPYQYVCDDYKNYSISSAGPDEEFDTEDDIGANEEDNS